MFEPFVIAHAKRIGIIKPDTKYRVCFSAVSCDRPAIALDVLSDDGKFERYYYKFGIVKPRYGASRNKKSVYDIGTHQDLSMFELTQSE